MRGVCRHHGRRNYQSFRSHFTHSALALSLYILFSIPILIIGGTEQRMIEIVLWVARGVKVEISMKLRRQGIMPCPSYCSLSNGRNRCRAFSLHRHRASFSDLSAHHQNLLTKLKTLSCAKSIVMTTRKTPLRAKDQNLLNHAFDGNLFEAHEVLRAGANVNAQRDDGTTAL